MGTAGGWIYLEGRLADEAGQPYERCSLSLHRASDGTPLDGGEKPLALDPFGRFSVGTAYDDFALPLYVRVTCEGAAAPVDGRPFALGLLPSSGGGRRLDPIVLPRAHSQ